MKLKYDFIIQKVGDTQVAVPAGDDANRFSGIIKLNTTGAVIFEMLKDEISAEQIARSLLEDMELRRRRLRSISSSCSLGSMKRANLRYYTAIRRFSADLVKRYFRISENF